MSKCKVSGLLHVPPDCKTVQCKSGELEKKYLSKGWRLKAGGNGSYVITKKSELRATLDTGDNINIRGCVLSYYGKSRLTDKLVVKFASALKDGKVGLYLRDGEYVIDTV